MKKITKQLLSIALVMAFLLLSIPMSVVETSATTKINRKTVVLLPGESVCLYLSTTKKTSWSSSNSKVASVNKKGIVTAKKAGSCTIKALLNKKTYSCKVSVKEKITDDMGLVSNIIAQIMKNLPENARKTFEVTAIRYGKFENNFYLDEATDNKMLKYIIEWNVQNISNTKNHMLLTISDNNLIYVNGCDLDTLELKAEDFYTEKSIIKNFTKTEIKQVTDLAFLILDSKYTYDPNKGKVGLDVTKTAISKGKNIKLSLRNTNEKITWSSSDNKVATVSSSGKVTGKTPGNCKIIAKTSTGTYKCYLTVTDSFTTAQWKLIQKFYETYLTYTFPKNFKITSIEYGTYVPNVFVASNAVSNEVSGVFQVKVCFEIKLNNGKNKKYAAYLHDNAESNSIIADLSSEFSNEIVTKNIDSTVSKDKIAAINNIFQSYALGYRSE